MERARDGAANGLALDQLITGSDWHESGLQRMLSACTAARLWCMRRRELLRSDRLSAHACGRGRRPGVTGGELPQLRSPGLGFRPGRGRLVADMLS